MIENRYTPRTGSRVDVKMLKSDADGSAVGSDDGSPGDVVSSSTTVLPGNAEGGFTVRSQRIYLYIRLDLVLIPPILFPYYAWGVSSRCWLVWVLFLVVVSWEVVYLAGVYLCFGPLVSCQKKTHMLPSLLLVGMHVHVVWNKELSFD